MDQQTSSNTAQSTETVEIPMMDRTLDVLQVLRAISELLPSSRSRAGHRERMAAHVRRVQSEMERLKGRFHPSC